MKFDKARNLVKLLLAMCIVFCTAGIITNGSQAGAISALISVLFFIMAFIVISLSVSYTHLTLPTNSRV